MTTMLAAVQALGDEFAGRMHALIPRYVPSIRFARIPLEDRDSRELVKYSRARLFDLDLDDPSWIQHDWVGSQAQGLTIEYPVRIAYHRAPGWQEAALDDFIAIQHDLWSNASTSAGVELRVIKDGPKFERIQDDPWLVMTITLHVVYSVSAT